MESSKLKSLKRILKIKTKQTSFSERHFVNQFSVRINSILLGTVAIDKETKTIIDNFFEKDMDLLKRSQPSSIRSKRETQPRQMIGRSMSEQTLNLPSKHNKKGDYLEHHLDMLKISPSLVCVCCSAKGNDHFIPFKYPSAMGTVYEKVFVKANPDLIDRTEKFNLDQEHKFKASPSKPPMELTTTQRSDYVGFKVKASGVDTKKEQNQLTHQILKDTRKPFAGDSYYRQNYPNFGEDGASIGKQIESRPHFPVYQLPFKGDSSYKKSFANERPNPEEPFIVQLKSDFILRQKNGQALKQDLPFQTLTSNMKNFQGSKPIAKNLFYAPAHEVPVTFEGPSQFKSTQRQEFLFKVRPGCKVAGMKEQMMRGSASMINFQSL